MKDHITELHNFMQKQLNNNLTFVSLSVEEKIDFLEDFIFDLQSERDKYLEELVIE